MEKTSTASTNTPLPSRAALYVRMSTEHQQYSPENQSDVIRQYAASHNMEVVQVYSDHGRSGLNIAGREGLNQLMSNVGKAAEVVLRKTTILIARRRGTPCSCTIRGRGTTRASQTSSTVPRGSRFPCQNLRLDFDSARRSWTAQRTSANCTI
jgi:hypothetical protein